MLFQFFVLFSSDYIKPFGLRIKLHYCVVFNLRIPKGFFINLMEKERYYVDRKISGK